jgi:hypothetical protein
MIFQHFQMFMVLEYTLLAVSNLQAAGRQAGRHKQTDRERQKWMDKWTDWWTDGQTRQM